MSRVREISTEAGKQYLDTLSSTDRRETGRVYTPLHLVRFILDAVGYTSSTSIEELPLLDPACGAGVFLEEALRRLAVRTVALQGDLRFPRASDVLLEAARRNLVGVDVDSDACTLAQTTLARVASELTGHQVTPDFFKHNVIEADFLGNEIVGPGGRLTILPRFAAIVGNPPYVATTRLTAAVKDELRREFRTASGRIDLYVLFFERSINLLRSGGRLSFVTPDKYLSSRSAAPLREFLRGSGAVRALARFESHKIFADAATVPCVTLFERGARQAALELLRCAEQLTADGAVSVVSSTKLSPAIIAGENWAAVPPDVQRLASKIRGMHPTLDGLSQRVSSGLATGRDGIYVFSAKETHGVEPELLHRAVRGRDIAPFSITDPNLLVLIPYTFEGRVPKLVDIRDFPGARRYLTTHRSELEARHCVRTWGKAWYDLHDPMSFALGKAPKLILPDIADRNRFAFDSGAYVPLHSAYYVVPAGIDPRFLLAVLNSAPIEFLVRITAPRVKDGFSRYRSQLLLRLPIPLTSEAVVRRIVKAYEREKFDEAIDIAEHLFGLTTKESAAVRCALSDLRGQPLKAR